MAPYFVPNQIKMTLSDLSDPVLPIASLAHVHVLCAPVRLVSLLLALPTPPRPFHPYLCVSSCGFPARMLSSLFLLCPAQFKSHVHRASLTYWWLFHTSPGRLLAFIACTAHQST